MTFESPDLSLPAISEVLLDLHRAGRTLPPGEFEPFAFERLARVVPHDAGLMARGVLVDGLPDIHDLYLHRLPADFVEGWGEVRFEDKVTAEATSKPGTTINATSREVHADVPHVLAKVLELDLEHVLLTAVLDARAGLSFAFAVYRTDLDRPFTEAERATVELVVPHVVEALAASRLEKLRADTHTPASPGVASAMVDRRGLVLEAEPAFVEHLETAFAPWSGPFLPDEIHRFLDSGDGERLVVRRLAVVVSPSGDRRLLRIRPTNLVDSLTHRELEVARWYATGASSDETARSLRIATNTVRAHLGRVYAKLGVENRAELATLLAGHP